MRNPRTYSRLLLSPALTLVVLMSGAILPQRLSRVEAAGHAHPQTIHASATGDIITPRAHPSATLLSNGKVLLACGYSAFLGAQLGAPLNSAELYDPATGTWSSTGNLSTTHGGEEFTTTLLQNGKVLIVGGSPGFGALNSAELYDSATGTWSLTGNLIQGRTYHAATLLANGEVLVVGGENRGLLTSAELYNPATGTWRSTGNLNWARSNHTATLLPNGKVLVVEGYGAGNTAELYDPATGTWSLTGNLDTSYYKHTTTLLPNGKALVVGSFYFGTNKTTELYDPATGTWTVTGPLNFGRLHHTATLLSNGKVLVLGGSDRPSSTVYDSAELYDPVTGAWTLAANLHTPRTWHTATKLPNGKVVIAGGGNASGLLSSTELYDPGIVAGANSLQFGAASYSASESDGKATIAVTRTDTSAAATVDYSTNDFMAEHCDTVPANASAKCDYTTAGGTLRFAPTEASKTIVLSIIDDAFVEGNEMLNVTLSSPTGATLGSPSATTITIQDNDTNPNAPNPFLNNAFFVRQQYLDFLLREPDTVGFNDWLNVLNTCGPGQGWLGSLPECDRVHVSSGFFRSPEFGEKGYWIYRFYESALGRRPQFAEFVPQMGRLSGLMTDAEQEARRADFIGRFMQLPEFIANFDGLTDSPSDAAAFIAKLEQAGRVTLPASANTEPGQPPQYGRQQLIDLMSSGQFTAAQTLRAFIEQKVVWDTYFFRAFVAMQYFGYLRRDPEPAGYDDWVDVLTNGRASAGIQPGDYRHLIFGFVYSIEYRERFGQP